MNRNISVHVESPMTDEERRRCLYQGDIVILPRTPASAELVALADRMLVEAFAPHHPREIHERLTPEDAAAVLAKLKPAFIHHPACKVLIPQIMREHGVDVEKLYFDVPRMRSAYPSDFLTSGIAYAFHAHRDTWYSAPQQQINWWMPIYPLAPDNAMAFYPRYFAEAVRNSSDTFNYYEWNEKNRASAASHIREDTRVQPRAMEPLDAVTVRLLPQPGSIILFSAAQLHETVENTAGVARYSIDFRTVHLDDVLARRGAPNVDAHCTGTTMRDYLRATDLSHLPEDAVQMYDDGTEAAYRTLYFGDKLAQGQSVNGSPGS
jgi:hypothetical protein